MTVIIVIGPGRRHTDAFESHARFIRDVSKSAIAVVAIESISSGGMSQLFRSVREWTRNVHDVEIRAAVIVVIAPSSSRSHVLRKLCASNTMEMLEMNTSLFGDVSELDSRIIWRDAGDRVFRIGYRLRDACR